MSFDDRNPPRVVRRASEESAHSDDHDIILLWSGDSPHPTAIKCETCDWNGVIHDGV